jgi:hypothetical protein
MRGLIAFAGICLLAASAEAGARSVVFTAPAPGQILQGGTVVEVSWSGVPANAEEVELLLSLDGGRRVALRLTEQLSSGDRSYLWRVPNLSAGSAALILRLGIGGREIESAPSVLFEILPEPSSRPAESLDWRAGELWLDEEGRPRGADPRPSAGLSDARPACRSPAGEGCDWEAPEDGSFSGGRASARRAAVRTHPSPASLTRIPVSARRVSPLRI